MSCQLKPQTCGHGVHISGDSEPHRCSLDGMDDTHDGTVCSPHECSCGHEWWTDSEGWLVVQKWVDEITGYVWPPDRRWSSVDGFSN